MSEETIPLTFTAVDNLTKAVQNMTAILEKMGAVQDDTTKSSEQLTDATKEQGEQAQVTSSKWEIVAAKLETAKAAYEFAAGAIGIVGEQITKANEAWDAQSKKLGKSASSLGSIAEANAKADKAQTKLYASIGKAIDQSGLFQSVAKAQEQTLKSLTKFINDNSESIAKFANEIGVNAAQKLQAFGKFIQENSDYIARFVLYIGNLKNAFDAVIGSVETFAKLFRTQVYGAVTIASAAIFNLLDSMVLLADLAGTGVPKALTDARDSAKSFSDQMAQNTVDSLEDTAKSAMNAGKSVLAFGSNLVDIATGTPEGLKGIKDSVEGIGKAAENTGKSIEKNLNLSSKGSGKSRKDLIDAETAAEEKRQALVLDYERRILEATKANNEELVIQLTKEKAIVEARQSLVGIKTKELKDATMVVATLQAELDYENSLKELAQKRREERAAAHDIEMQRRQEIIEQDAAEDEKLRERYENAIARINARYDLETERITQVGDYIAEAFGNVPNVIDNISESTQRMVDGFAKAVPQIANLVNSFRAFNKQGATAADQQEAINAGISAGAGVLSGVTQSFIEDKKKQAAIEALINAAAAAASYATGNIPAGIAYTAAAVTYGAAAAFSGGGGGSSGGGGAASSFASSPPTMTNADDERRANAQAIAEAISSQRENAPVVINLSFDNALIAADSPQAGRIISDLIKPEIENIIRSGG